MEYASASEELIQYTNDELRFVAIEIRKIGMAKAPADVPRSNKMQKLFNLETRIHNFWIDRYHNVSQAIEKEVISRFRQGVI